jgi:hypothetical protein
MRLETLFVVPWVAGWLVLAPLAAAAEYPDWAALAEVEVIDVLTVDEDGDLRTTPVWFVLLDGEPHLRTSGSTWLENLRRDPRFRLVIEEREYTARAKEVTSEGIVARVDAASLAKYGWQESFIHFFRLGTPEILKLSPAP